ncbi:MAG: phage holin family protein [Acidobacteria bacterium]|nr:phage holin family protein [Acidobacteriota bacterium]
MRHLILSWLIGAFSLWIVGQIVPGIYVKGFGAALLATIIIAVVNATIGFFVKIVTFPLTLLTLGLFLLVINAFLLKLSSLFVPGFSVQGFLAALLGSIALTLVNAAIWFALRL